MTEVGVIPEDWEVKKLGDLLDYEQPTSYLVKNTKYSNSSSIPVLTAGKTFILGYTDENFGVFQDLPVIIFDDFTTASRFIDFPFKVKSSAMKMLKARSNEVNLRLVYELMQLIDFTVADHKRHWISEYQNFEIAIPDSQEQRSIARVLSDTDALINALDKLIAKKRDIKKAVMQELLTGKTRLPGFSGEWEVKRLGDLFNITAGKDLIRDQYSEVADNSFPFPIYSNSLSNFGLYGYSSFGQNEAGCITVTARGTLGYACYRTTPFVAIGRLLILKPKITLNGFFISELINHCIEFASESTGVPQLTSPQISKYELSIPSPEEQQAIAQVLSDMDREITALEQRRDKTKALKQGMMQELLTGRIRLH